MSQESIKRKLETLRIERLELDKEWEILMENNKLYFDRVTSIELMSRYNNIDREILKLGGNINGK